MLSHNLEWLIYSLFESIYSEHSRLDDELRGYMKKLSIFVVLLSVILSTISFLSSAKEDCSLKSIGLSKADDIAEQLFIQEHAIIVIKNTINQLYHGKSLLSLKKLILNIKSYRLMSSII